MKRLFLTMIFLSVASECTAIWIKTSLENRIKRADLIIVGTLTSVEPMRFSITYHDYYMSPIEQETQDARDYIFHYNAGQIQVDRVLKGNWTKDFVPFAYYENSELEIDGRKKRAWFPIFDDLKFTKGQSGVWILQSGGHFFHWFAVNYPGNLLSIDSIPEVERLIEGTEN